MEKLNYFLNKTQAYMSAKEEVLNTLSKVDKKTVAIAIALFGTAALVIGGAVYAYRNISICAPNLGEVPVLFNRTPELKGPEVEDPEVEGPETKAPDFRDPNEVETQEVKTPEILTLFFEEVGVDLGEPLTNTTDDSVKPKQIKIFRNGKNTKVYFTYKNVENTLFAKDGKLLLQFPKNGTQYFTNIEGSQRKELQDILRDIIKPSRSRSRSF